MTRSASTTQDQTDEPSASCPICDEPIENTEHLGPVTVVLRPCGHQVDEHVYAGLIDG